MINTEASMFFPQWKRCNSVLTPSTSEVYQMQHLIWWNLKPSLLLTTFTLILTTVSLISAVYFLQRRYLVLQYYYCYSKPSTYTTCLLMLRWITQYFTQFLSSADEAALIGVLWSQCSKRITMINLTEYVHNTHTVYCCSVRAYNAALTR